MRDQVPPTPRPTFTSESAMQTFTPSGLALIGLCVPLPLHDWHSYLHLTVSLYNVDENQQPTGSALCSTTFAASSLDHT